MPIFETLPIIEYIPQQVFINNPNDASLTAANGNNAGTCSDSTYNNDRPGCSLNNEEWTNTFTFHKQTDNKVVNLDLITSFQEGIRTYTDPGGSFQEGDANAAETFVTMGGINKQFLVDQSFNDFRSRMAKLF